MNDKIFIPPRDFVYVYIYIFVHVQYNVLYLPESHLITYQSSKKKIWIYWSESTSWINFYIVLNKNWKIYWSKLKSFTGIWPEDWCSFVKTANTSISLKRWKKNTNTILNFISLYLSFYLKLDLFFLFFFLFGNTKLTSNNSYILFGVVSCNR